MAKKKLDIQIDGLDSTDFNKSPDVDSAKKVVEKPSPVKKKRAESKATTKQTEKIEKSPKKSRGGERSNFPPPNKKRASFNIDADLHKALKQYSFFQEIDMVEYVFEQLVKPDLTKKGYYPPKAKR